MPAATPAASQRVSSGLGDSATLRAVLARQLWRLGKHSAIYGLGAVVSRLIGLFLLPVVTRYLTRGDLGAVDTLIEIGRAHV